MLTETLILNSRTAESISRRATRRLSLIAVAGVLVGVVLAATMAPAQADSASLRDPRGDAPARFDLTKVTVSNSSERLYVRVRVQDLRGQGTQIFGVGISSHSYTDYYSMNIVRRPSGSTRAELVDFGSDGAVVPCKISRDWLPRADVIRVSIPRQCIGIRGPLRISADIGAGNGSAGDPADFTKSIRVSQR